MVRAKGEVRGTWGDMQGKDRLAARVKWVGQEGGKQGEGSERGIVENIHRLLEFRLDQVKK